MVFKRLNERIAGSGEDGGLGKVFVFTSPGFREWIDASRVRDVIKHEDGKICTVTLDNGEEYGTIPGSYDDVVYSIAQAIMDKIRYHERQIKELENKQLKIDPDFERGF